MVFFVQLRYCLLHTLCSRVEKNCTKFIYLCNVWQIDFKHETLIQLMTDRTFHILNSAINTVCLLIQNRKHHVVIKIFNEDQKRKSKRIVITWTHTIELVRDVVAVFSLFFFILLIHFAWSGWLRLSIYCKAKDWQANKSYYSVSIALPVTQLFWQRLVASKFCSIYFSNTSIYS